jgi:hypothetical protein
VTAPEAERVGGLRLIRRVLVILCVLVAGLCGSQTAAFIANKNRVDDINAERTRNTVAACVRLSEQNQAILDYLKSLGGTPKDIDAADDFFPVLTVAECELRAAEQVTK